LRERHEPLRAAAAASETGKSAREPPATQEGAELILDEGRQALAITKPPGGLVFFGDAAGGAFVAADAQQHDAEGPDVCAFTGEMDGRRDPWPQTSQVISRRPTTAAPAVRAERVEHKISIRLSRG
jgi:hypothetical protein